MVVRHFSVVHAAGVETCKVEDSGAGGESRHDQDSFQQSGHAGHHVVRDVAASRSRVGNEFLLVERLGDVQRLCRGQVEMHVAVLLECRQVVEQRRLLQGSPAFHLRDRRTGIGRDTAVGRLSLLSVTEVRRVEEAAVRIPVLQGDVQLPVRCGDKTPVLPVAAAYYGERWRLYPSDGVVGRAGDDGQGTARVHAHQPVGLRAAVGGGIQAVVLRTVFQFLQPFPYGLVGQRGDPQAAERFRTLQKGVYPAEDKFPLATGIGSHDDAVTLGEHAVDDLQLFRGGDVRDHAPVRAYLAGDQAERYGQHRQVLRRRFRVTVNVRHGQRHEVSQRPGYYVSVAGTVAVISCISPDYTGYVQAYARFFCDDCYHNVRIKLRPFPVFHGKTGNGGKT